MIEIYHRGLYGTAAAQQRRKVKLGTPGKMMD